MSENNPQLLIVNKNYQKIKELAERIKNPDYHKNSMYTLDVDKCSYPYCPIHGNFKIVKTNKTNETKYVIMNMNKLRSKSHSVLPKYCDSNHELM